MKNWKIDEKIRFLRVMLLIRGVLQCREDFVKKRTEVPFSIFIENRNWDLKFVFRFDNENEKRKKKTKLYFILKQKSNVPFDPRIQSVHRKCHSIFRLKLEWKRAFLRISISIQNWKLKKDISFSIFNFQFLFKKWKIRFVFKSKNKFWKFFIFHFSIS